MAGHMRTIWIVLLFCLSVLLVPAPGSGGERVQTPVERMFTDRAGLPLVQFGYDLFATAGLPPAPSLGVVADDHVLGPGDRLRLVVRGHRARDALLSIGADGLLLVDELPPIRAAGRSLGAVRTELEAAFQDAMLEVSVFLSLLTARQMAVMVVGAVARPGLHAVSARATVFEALAAAGGVLAEGSLRRIRLVTPGPDGPAERPVDLYDLLLAGRGAAFDPLVEGSRVVVPPLGPTVAVSGLVNRPGIYELPAAGALSARDLLDLAGGPLHPGAVQPQRLSIGADGRDRLVPVTDLDAPVFGHGDLLVQAPRRQDRRDRVTLTGAVRLPGPRPLAVAPSLRALLDDPAVLADEAYPLFGVILRRDPASLAIRYLPFTPVLILSGASDRRLEDGDEVRLFTRAEITALTAGTDPDTTDPGPAPPDPTLAEAPDPVLGTLLRDRRAWVRGAVHRPGAYPLGGPVDLGLLLAAAGGLVLEAERTGVEWLRPARDGAPPTRTLLSLDGPEAAGIQPGPGDSLRIASRRRDPGGRSVVLAGEVARPGIYDIAPGERLSMLLTRAGGLTALAYPPGAVLTRESARRAEQEGLRRTADGLEAGLTAVIAGEREGRRDLDTAAIEMTRRLAQELREAPVAGRVVVQADPAMLARRPELDLPLEPGDRLFVPQNPGTVRVMGEVMAPAILPFDPLLDAGDYLDRAGGLTRAADRGRIFILQPDGSALPMDRGWSRHSLPALLPGATIVVPRDPEPFSLLGLAQQVTSVLSQLALTAAAVASLTD